MASIAVDRETRKLKRELKKLSDAVLLMLDAIGREMKSESTEARGRRIARICNDMEYVNDQVRYFALGVNFRKDDKKKVVLRLLKKYGVSP